MNEVIISGIVKGDLESIGNDGIKFLVLNRGRSGENDEFICLAYGNSSSFLSQHVVSGQRVVLQGRLSGEKLGTENYHTAITVGRVLSISDSSSGMDYTNVVLSGEASSKGLTRLNNKNKTPLVPLNIRNKREYKPNDGEVQEYTTFIDAAVWGKLAESVEESFELPMNNTQVVVYGMLKPRSYENKNGETVNKIEIWVTSINRLEGVQTQTSASRPQGKKEDAGTRPPRKSKSLEDAPF